MPGQNPISSFNSSASETGLTGLPGTACFFFGDFFAGSAGFAAAPSFPELSVGGGSAACSPPLPARASRPFQHCSARVIPRTNSCVPNGRVCSSRVVSRPSTHFKISPWINRGNFVTWFMFTSHCYGRKRRPAFSEIQSTASMALKTSSSAARPWVTAWISSATRARERSNFSFHSK